MDGLSSLTTLDGRSELVRQASARLVIDATRLFEWIKDKGRQLRSLPGNEDLIRAVFSHEKAPIEGSRYRVGQCVRAYQLDGETRRFRICGVRSGGFSNAYPVIDLDEMQAFCLKENRALPGNEESKNRKLAIEARISLTLGVHPHLVTTYGAFFIQNRLFLLTEYLPSTSLDEHLKAGPLQVETALKYAAQICRGITYARSILPGFVHGDIKPANCLLSSGQDIKLADFGLASAEGHSYRIDPEGNAVGASAAEGVGWGGTAAYMAPELFDKTSDRDFADIYAFGVTLFEMLDGTRPFAAASKRDLIQLHRQAPPPVERLSDRGVPGAVCRLIKRCLAKSPSDRPDNFEIVETELTQGLFDRSGRTIPTAKTSDMTPEQYSRRAFSMAVVGCHREAAQLIDSFSERFGRSPDLLAAKAAVLVSGGLVDEAYENSTAALRTGAGSFRVLLAHAQALVACGDRAAAESYTERALRIRPDNCVALNFMGRLLTDSEQYREAASFFESSIRLDRTQPTAWAGLADAELRSGRTKKAVRCAKRSIALDPSRVSSHTSLGDAYLDLGRSVEAVKAYKAALELEPASKEIRKRFIRCCISLYRSSGVAADPRPVRLLVRGASFSREDPERRAAANGFVATFLTVFESRDLDPMLIFFLDTALLRAADDLDPELSANLFAVLKTFLERSESSIVPEYCLNSLGKIFYRTRRIDESQTIFRRILERFGPNENSFYYLGACCEVTKEFTSALKYYRKARRLYDCEDTRTGIRRVTAALKNASKLESPQ